MLLRFSVSNFGSIRDKQELSMIASHAIKDEPGGLIDAPELRKEKVLPAAVIYGANASGKSNFVKALAHMRMLVRDSHRRGEPGEPVPLKPFLLNPDYAEKATTFTIDFILNGARYVYGFDVTRAEFVSEFLHVWRGGPRTMLFERGRDKFEFGRSLKGENRVIEKLTRPNSLLLSAAAQNNHEQLTEVAAFLVSISIDFAVPVSAKAISRRLARSNIDNRVTKLLSEIDIGTKGTRVVSPDKNKESVEFIRQVSEKLDDFLKKEFGATSGASDTRIADVSVSGPESYIQLAHNSTDGGTVYFNMDDESAGTVQLLSILGPIFSALDEGRIVVIDEFGSRLHTRAAEMILELFNNKQTNPKGAQLVVATHDTNLLNAKSLRRDQVWFTEKDAGGATHLYPLTDIETRKGDNLEKGYLQGRYGAIPFAGPLADLVKAG